MVWTKERIELLKTLWAQGLSAQYVAAELKGVSRNAVIGKVHRLGLAGRTRRPTVVPRPRRDNKKLIRRAASQGTYFREVELPPAPEPETPEEDLLIPLRQRKQLLELDDVHCHWPVGDVGTAEFFYCGAPAASGESYCPAHCRRAWMAPRVRTGGHFTFHRNNAA